MRRNEQSIESMVEENNQRREKLTDENKAYYEQLLVYIRSAGLFYDDYEIENLLLQILQDIQSAQNDGQSAEQFFGKRPQVAADKLIRHLGKASWKEILKLIGLVFGISSFFVILTALTSPKQGINILVIILNGLLSFLAVGLIFFIIHKNIYAKIIKGNVMSYLLPWLFFSVLIGLFVLIQIFTPPLLTLYLPNLFGIFILSILLVGISVRIMTRGTKERRGWWPFVPIIYIFGLIGIASRLLATANWMASSSGKIAIVILIGCGLILNWLGTFILVRVMKKE